jgi:hypothetical protein
MIYVNKHMGQSKNGQSWDTDNIGHILGISFIKIDTHPSHIYSNSGDKWCRFEPYNLFL